MKKLSAILIALLTMTQPLIAESGAFHLDGRVGAFFPTNKSFRQIFGKCLPCYEIEAGMEFCNDLEFWGNIDWVSTTGHTRTFRTKTSFNDLNVSLGVKYITCMQQCTQFYLGGGINTAFVHVHNHSEFVKRHVNKVGVGGVVKAGFYFHPMDNLFLEVFSDYLYQRIDFGKHVQVGGVKVGGGIGFNF